MNQKLAVSLGLGLVYLAVRHRHRHRHRTEVRRTAWEREAEMLGLLKSAPVGFDNEDHDGKGRDAVGQHRPG
jgi:hypothetical protein